MTQASMLYEMALDNHNAQACFDHENCHGYVEEETGKI